MTEPIGLYIHVPFCVSKCPYCDFYSLSGPTDEGLDQYTAAVERELSAWYARFPEEADTLYFGGGTPSLLGPARLTRLIEKAAGLWGLHGAEITLEANPADDLYPLLRAFAAAGGNRLSMGMQAITSGELSALGRRHTPQQTRQAVEAAHRAGIDNLSLDIMLGIPAQTTESAVAAVHSAAEWGAAHLSAYLLKIEDGTPFAARRDVLALPDEDELADRYLAVADAAEQAGYQQYEISNFARPGRESRHNLKYWNLQPYIGIGPSAHSFADGRRSYYPRDLIAFIAGNAPIPETPPDETVAEGSPEEYLMLRMRLSAGIDDPAFRRRFGRPLPALWRQRAAALPPSLVRLSADGFQLTREGFLVSNTVIAHLLGL